jgi:hypothetical protein
LKGDIFINTQNTNSVKKTIEKAESNHEKLYQKPYKIIDGSLYVEMTTKQGTYDRKLCNFTPYLISEVTVDDGLEPAKMLRLGGKLAGGRTLPEIEINGAEFASFNWLLDKWGVDCVLEVGRNVKDNIRHAIQLTAPMADKSRVYTVTGWKNIGGFWRYLLPNDPRFDVKLSGKLKNYYKEQTYSKTDISNVFKLSNFPPVKKHILYPLIAYTFLTPLGEFLKQAGCEPKFVLFLVGHTGTRKSTLAALFLSFFGQFTNGDLPLSFRDTANSILHNAFTLKDVLTCIDDFHPAGKDEERKLNSTAQSVMRAYGDRTGRGRLRADSTLMESRPPQGNAIITAEFSPDVGESGTARYFALEIKENDVDLDCLTVYQNEAEKGGFRRCMLAYTEYLRKYYLCTYLDVNKFTADLKSRFVSAREDFLRKNPNSHGRIPEAVACLKIGFDFYLDFMEESDMLNPISADKLRQEFLDYVYAQASEQCKSISDDKPTRVFVRKLYSLLESGQAYVMKRGEQYEPTGGAFVGWEDDDFYYLNCDSALKAVRRLCDEEGTQFSITLRGLLRSLAEDGLIEMKNDNYTRQIKINGKNKRVMCLVKKKSDTLRGYPQKSGTSVTFDEKASVYAGFGGHGNVKKAGLKA